MSFIALTIEKESLVQEKSEYEYELTVFTAVMPPDDVCTAYRRPQVRHSPQAPPSGKACRSGKSFYLYRPISDRHGSGFHLGEVRFGRGTASCFPPEAGTVRRKVPR